MTITDLYRQETGDLEAHQRTIAAALARLSDRTQALIRLRAAGQSWRELAAPLEITHTSAKSSVCRGLASMRKRIAGAPRYHISGRGQGK